MVTVGQELIVNFTHPPLPVTVHREHLNSPKVTKVSVSNLFN